MMLRRTARPTPLLPVLTRAALLGAASGSRSMTGLAAVAATTPKRPRGIDRRLGSTTATALTALAAAGELVGDKLPNTPSRLQPAGMVGRAVTAAVCGAAIAGRETPSRQHRPGVAVTVAAVAVASASMVVTARLGVAWRSWAAPRLGRDLPGALIEDGVAGALAWAGTR